MGQIPADATHWDCGDWIAWHRNGTSVTKMTCAAIGDQSAKLNLLQVSLLRAAKSFHELTGSHLDIFNKIARVHAALYFGIPLAGETPLEETGVLLFTLGPDSESLSVDVDFSLPFTSVLVVRTNSNFRVEGRMVTRRALGENSEGTRTLRWQHLPRGR